MDYDDAVVAQQIREDAEAILELLTNHFGERSTLELLAGMGSAINYLIRALCEDKDRSVTMARGFAESLVAAQDH